ncbi:AarF/ABC1/UbiB kinase family protein [uncultured Methanobrevibacter sp.]|uniref:ABC1 kinase family protein n=1 Tax=uncultured Methanobrevibacter sp. TaxID=253161 RepID=UPI00260423EF|nr:AarF/ABC1/UbiB kinase family protein [uncultured Methanobrevibacter sp.]
MKIISNTKNDSIKRIEEIYKVLKKNDFGYLIEENTSFKNFPFLKDTKRGKYNELPDESIPKRIKNVLEELGPTYIKLGQMLSTRPDLIGIDIAKELESLRDNTPTTPFSEIKKVIEKELKKPITEIYKEIDENPLGSASIGQVHKGVLLENNEEVAIKVQKPGVRETIESDLKIMKFLSEKIGKYIHQTKIYNIPGILNEFERSIFKEIDYTEELINMKNLAHNFKGIHYIHIPKPYPEYCTQKIITMELIKGKEVATIMNHECPQYNKKLIAKRGVKSYFKQIMIDGFFHADPHPGNMMIIDNDVLCYIDEGMMGILDDDFREELAELILLLLSRNVDNIINQLIYMDILTPAQNTPELKADVNDIMNKYYGADLKDMHGGIQQLLQIMIKHNIQLPKEFVMIGRGMTLIEDTGMKLDPNFNAVTELKKLSKKIIIQKYSPNRLAKVSSNYMLQMEHLAKDLPMTINNMLLKLEEGNLSVKLKHESISEIMNQLSISLILSALIIGSSLAIMSDKGPKIFDVSILGLIGFVFSAALGIYLVIQFMLKEK